MRLRTILLCWLSALTTFGQTAYKGQLHVSGERFSVQGQLLRVYMKVSYDASALNTGETLLFTPVLKTPSHYARMTTVAINGDSRERYEQRTDRLQQRRRINIPVVTRDARTGTRSFVYDTTIPYQSWMAGSALYIECEESTWQGRHPHTYEDLLLSRLPMGRGGSSVSDVPSDVSETPRSSVMRISNSWVQFLAPAVSSVGSTMVTGRFLLPYDMRLSKRHYRQLADSLQEVIGRETSTYATRLLSVELTGYGAPIGNRRKNERRAAEQTLQLRQLLTDRHVTGENDLRVTWVAEDWDSIRQLVTDAPMPLRLAAEDIIRNIDVTQGREDALRTLGSGSAYSYLRRSVFPAVCRLSYRLRFTPRAVGFTADGRLNYSLPQGITADNFYALASTYEVGSREFNDIIDLAARLFPDCAEACIDAAGVALLQGDAQKARRYITPWDTDRRSWCNLGLLHLLEGNRDKAEVYLKMADAAGVPQAREALRMLFWGQPRQQ